MMPYPDATPSARWKASSFILRLEKLAAVAETKRQQQQQDECFYRWSRQSGEEGWLVYSSEALEK